MAELRGIAPQERQAKIQIHVLGFRWIRTKFRYNYGKIPSFRMKTTGVLGGKHGTVASELLLHVRFIFGLFRFTPDKLVFLNDPNLLRKVLSAGEYDDSLNDRPPFFAAKYTVKNKDVMLGRFSDQLIALRKVLHGSLGMYGEGVQRFEDVIQTEIGTLLSKMEDTNGGDFDLKIYFKHSISNVISTLLSGETFDEEDPGLDMFWEYNRWSQQLIHPSNDKVLSIFPFLRHLPGRYGNVFRSSMKARKNILERFFLQAKKTYCSGEIRGIVDHMLSIKEDQEARGNPWFTDDHIGALIQDIIAAGLTTSFEALTGLFLILLEKKEIQTSIQAEIDLVIGNSRPPRITDRNEMPYSQAVILETLRYISQVPLSIPHYCSKSVAVEGYSIEEGSLVFPYLWGIHHSEELWEEPWEMNPRRFLDDEGNLLPPEHPKRQNLLPFGVGRRMCPGEAFGKGRLFLYMTNLLQRFDFLPPDEASLPSHDPRTFEPSVTLVPPDYTCRIRRR
ncbi:hypothetical protein ScPMuIL_015455 [Solemya velum]